MSTYTQFVYHIVFSTKNRIPAITEDNQRRLYTYLWNILKSKGCHVYRIGGIEDHIHILTDIHQSLAVSDVVRELKANSSKYIRDNKLFPKFEGWQVGYGGFTCSYKEIEILVNYISNQKEHHLTTTYLDELKKLLIDHNVPFEEKYLL